jgi:hypothetical protein
MSAVIYPLSLLQTLSVRKFAPVITDEFEAGAVSTRRQWAERQFKRMFDVSHSPLTPAEFRYLKSFVSARGGKYDSFWFRDNLNRDGNAQVRFAEDLRVSSMGRMLNVQVSLEEIAPVRALPELEDVVTATGLAPALWYDPNREIYYSHAGTAISGESAAYDATGCYAAPWQAGALLLGGATEQHQYHTFSGASWALAPNLSLAGTQPACTIFVIARHAAVAAKQVLISTGAMGSGAALGIAIAADNYYEPWLGGSESWTNARLANDPASTWRSLCVVWAASSNIVSLYAGGYLLAVDTVERSLVAGPIALGAALDGTLKVTGDVAQALIFAGALSADGVRALHELFAYQHGVETLLAGVGGEAILGVGGETIIGP